jgi:hypothetical protein
MPGLSTLATTGFYCTSTFDNRFFIAGGEGSDGTLHEAVWTGADSMILEERASMIRPRRKYCMTQFSKECLIVTGGWKTSSKRAMRECELYNIKSNTWLPIPPMNEARQAHAGVQVKDGLVYVFCGHNGYKFLNSYERYTKSNNLWEIISTDNKIQARIDLGVVAINNGEKVVIFGGSDGKNRLSDVYELHTSSSRIELINSDTKVKVVPGYHPVNYDVKN